MNSKIEKMLKGMEAKEKRKRSTKKETWFVYILQCNDGSYYTGVTKDMERRFKMHNDGKASRYTRSRRPVKLQYQETCRGRTQALVRECKVKSFPRGKKQALIKQNKKSRLGGRNI